MPSWACGRWIMFDTKVRHGSSHTGNHVTTCWRLAYLHMFWPTRRSKPTFISLVQEGLIIRWALTIGSMPPALLNDLFLFSAIVH